MERRMERRMLLGIVDAPGSRMAVSLSWVPAAAVCGCGRCTAQTAEGRLIWG